MSPVYKKPRAPDAAYQFTVLTPTFNRAHTLPRVYQSLTEQSFQGFEWLIIDDGSTDGTAELVRQWQQEASFPIVYHWQENQHKKVAFNRGVQRARGELIVALDSDDQLLVDALYGMARVWWSIPDEQREQFVGVTGLCQYPDGSVVGDLFPYDALDTNALDLFFKYKVRGEKFGCLDRRVLLQFPFPEYAGFVPESLVWRAIARAGYKQRFVNQVFRVYHLGAQSLSAEGRTSRRHAMGLWLLAQDTLAACMPWFDNAPKEFFYAAARYVRFRLHMWVQGQIPPKRPDTLGVRAKGLVALMAPVGVLLFIRDSLRWRKAKP